MTKFTDHDVKPIKVGLFDDLPVPSLEQIQQAQAKPAGKRGQASPRRLQANRSQIELRASDLASLLAEDHRARLVRGYVVHHDLSQLIEAIKAVTATPVVRRSTRAFCPPFGRTPRWTAWAAGAKSPG